MGLKSTFSLTDGKLKLVVKRREKGGDKLEKVEDLEVGAPALRQGVILLPAGQGVPVRVVKGGNETLVVEVDDESMFVFVSFFLESLFFLARTGFSKERKEEEKLLIIYDFTLLEVLADFAVARGFFKGGPLALADRKPCEYSISSSSSSSSSIITNHNKSIRVEGGEK